MNYVGIDHHRQYSHLTVMDQTGQVLRSGQVPNLQAEIAKFLEGFEAVQAVLEKKSGKKSLGRRISFLIRDRRCSWGWIWRRVRRDYWRRC